SQRVIDHSVGLAEVPLPFERRRYSYCREVRCCLPQRKTFVTAKHEDLVLKDRPAASTSKLIALEFGQLRWKVEGSCIEHAVADELPEVGMPFICSGFGDDVDLRAGSVAVFCGKLCGLNLKFGDGIENRRQTQRHVIGIQITYAIEQECIVICAVARS